MIQCYVIRYICIRTITIFFEFFRLKIYFSEKQSETDDYGQLRWLQKKQTNQIKENAETLFWSAAFVGKKVNGKKAEFTDEEVSALYRLLNNTVR